MWYIIDISAEKEGTPLEDLKVITASNIINLRTKAGMTQAELGELLSYSDKSISKWERAEAIPDAFVLKSMSEIFGVSVDYILSAHDKWQPEPEKAEAGYSSNVITMISIVGIFTLALLAFIVTWILESPKWIIFIWMIPVLLVTHLVLNSVFKKGKNNFYIVAALVASVIAVVYLTFISQNWWPLFILIVPAEVIVFLCFRVKKTHK
ncbi:MAG: helix-turn-helix domain-containing protein [Oscillospiraceae bacterium]